SNNAFAACNIKRSTHDRIVRERSWRGWGCSLLHTVKGEFDATLARAAPRELLSPLWIRAGAWAPRLPSPTNCRGSSYLSLTSAFDTPEGLLTGLHTGRGQSGFFISITDLDIGSGSAGLGGRLQPRISPGSYPRGCHNRGLPRRRLGSTL